MKMETAVLDETETTSTSLENYFSSFRENIIGNRQPFTSPFGTKEIIYADWTASGRAYRPIEEKILKEVLPFVGNTHTEATITGTHMSKAYEEAKRVIKKHVNASGEDVLLFCGSGMTAAVNKLQRMLGLRVPGSVKHFINGGKENWLPIDDLLKPLIFITHMEHHSNYISWLETIADVEIIEPGKEGNVDLTHFEYLLDKYKHRKNKIAAVTACSNVTGIQTPYHEIAKLIHRHQGFCFVDFACSAPYVPIDMHPAETGSHLDAIFFSPHKFLGGPGTPGILLFNKKICKNTVPDHPGGGTVVYSNPWKGREYVQDIEEREDGGTPPFLGAIKAALAVRLKEQMGIENIIAREKEMLRIVFKRFSTIPAIKVLEDCYTERLGVISFMATDAHYNLFVTILNDRFGIQSRGGCSCAGTYGHFMLNIDKQRSLSILQKIRAGNYGDKPGWVRISIHPCMTDKEIDFIMDAIELTATNFSRWAKDYSYHAATGSFAYRYSEPCMECDK